MSGVFVCGIDEAGRGPLAGPVSAAAVILPESGSGGFRPEGGEAGDFPFEILNDSKKLSPAAREKTRVVICSEALAWGIGWASPAEIDRINIHNASLLAMKRAFEAIPWKNPPGKIPTLNNVRAVVDGLFVPDISVPREALVKADSLVPAVMAASILAKTARDRLMDYYALFYPEYGYEKHKGYPTKAHREAVLRFGPSPIQRLSFRVSG